MYKSEVLRILDERGFLYQLTDASELDQLLAAQSVNVYWGCDATASSLHVGNLMGLMVMKWFQETGHTPILLVGGGTTKIGDPSGRDTSRQLLGEERIAENIQGIKYCFSKLISLEDALLVDNAQWLEKLVFIPFLRDIGVHFSINRMLTFESIKSRLDREQPLSYIEFNYMLLQAYDFLELYRHHQCHLQIGGSDQWGNIVSGVDLVRRVEGGTVFGLTWPLLQTSSGAKMGKSAQGAIWLDESLLSPYDYWQFWRNVEDNDVLRFFKLYTMMPLEEIEKFASLKGQELCEAKIVLADQATALLHGPEILSSIHATVNQVFSGQTIDVGQSQLPKLPLPLYRLKEGLLCLDILGELGLVSSRREGRQKIREGAVSIEGQKIRDELHKLTLRDFEGHEVLKISVGTKKHGLILKQGS